MVGGRRGQTRGRRPWVAAGDGGVTLVELLMSMSIMLVVMAVFTTGIIQLYRVSNAAGARSDAQARLSAALLRLDKQARTAAGISAPYLNGGNQYVELLVIRT